MVSENGVDVAKLRALLSDHAPQTFMQRDQMKVADVWEALPELLRVYEAWQRAEAREIKERSVTYGHGSFGRELVIHMGDDYGKPFDWALVGKRVRVLLEEVNTPLPTL